MAAIPSTTILELSQRDADVVHLDTNGKLRNGDYTCRFSENVTLKEGDQLNLRMASIDSQRATTESVVIPEGGLPISMQLSYYDRNYQIPTPGHPAGSASPPDPAQQKVQFGTRGTTDTAYEPDFKFYLSYIEPGAQRLESFTMKGLASCPYPTKASLGTEPPFGDCVIVAPIFSWCDAETNELRQNTAAFGIGASNVQAVDNFPDFQGHSSYSLGGQPKPDPYQYMGFNTINDSGNGPYNNAVKSIVCKPHSQLTHDQLKVINNSRGFPYGNGVESKTIDFKTGSLRLIGVIAITMAEFSRVVGLRDETGYGLYNQSGLKNFIETSSSNTPIAVTGNKQLLTKTAGFTIPAGRYDRETLAQVITEGFSEVGLTDEQQPGGAAVFGANTNLQLRMDSTESQLILFRKIPENDEATLTFDATNSYQYATNATTTIGARIFAMEYGNIGNAYQISNLHQSLNSGLDSEEKQEQSVIFAQDIAGKNTFHQLLSSTGCVVHDLSPKDFWQTTLALYDNLVVPLQTDDDGVNYYTESDMINKITSETAQIQSFSVNNQRGTAPPTPGAPNQIKATYFDTTANPTKSIIGDTPTISEDSGTYYMIEITGLNIPQSNLITNNQNLANISAIVSKQYDSDDIVTAFADSAIPYVHRGMPVKISSARVRIIDPVTKEVVTTLGDQNSVFLQLSSVQQPLPTQNQVQGTVPK
jgi:hypothetical protein